MIHDESSINDDVKIKWRKCIKVYGTVEPHTAAQRAKTGDLISHVPITVQIFLSALIFVILSYYFCILFMMQFYVPKLTV